MTTMMSAAAAVTIRPMSWDHSVIGVTPAEKAEMDMDEQRERATDELNRAADIVQAVLCAFPEHFRPTERRALCDAANVVIGVTRSEP